MKMALGVIVGVVLGVLILIAGGALLVKYALSQVSLAANQTAQPPSSPLFGTPSFENLQPTVTEPNVTEPTPTNNSPSIPSTNSSEEVNFDLQNTTISGEGLTRTVTGEITKTGSQDAHNVVGKIEVFSGGKQIKITDSGQTSISQNLGTIKAGQAVTTKIELKFGFFDSPTLMQNGATVNLEITSDEKTQTITYDYKP